MMVVSNVLIVAAEDSISSHDNSPAAIGDDNGASEAGGASNAGDSIDSSNTVGTSEVNGGYIRGYGLPKYILKR